jgi:hypothetical protein
VNPDNTSRTVAEEAREAADSLAEILRTARAEDRSVVPDLQGTLDSPEATEALGNLARRVELQVVDAISLGNADMREAMLKKLAAMRAELAGPNPTPLELQIVERIVLSWLAVHDAELQASDAEDHVDYWQRRIDHAHKRHLSAIKALATIRKLALPVLIGQLNVSQRQVNTAEIRSAGPPVAARPAAADGQA